MRRLGRPVIALLVALAATLPPAAPVAAASVTLTLTGADLGPVPRLGYNLGHWVEGSNAADWWRYSGLANARVFVSPSDIEPSDDLAPAGDGVTSQASFASRRTALRGAAVAAGTTDETYIRWSAFIQRYRTATGDTNELTVDHAFGALRDQGVEILANLTASPSRFPISSDADWAGMWELWQHYYAQGFLLSSRYGVTRFGTFNEPNNWNGMTPTDWLRRLRICADALRAGVADAATRDGVTRTATIYAPGTANGASKYADWGSPAVTGRHLRWDGTVDPGWTNLDRYAYQKYSMNATGSATAYGEDASSLAGLIAADLPADVVLPLALTEFNVRTGSDYDGTSATLDTPADFVQLAVNTATVTARGVREIFLFKMAQTERSGGTYPVAKNGTHYVQNADPGHRYGGATKGAEVWRMIAAACAPGRRLAGITTSLSSLALLACRQDGGRALDVIVANPSTSSHTLTLDVSALGIPSGASVVLSEVSAGASGGVVTTGTIASGRIAKLPLPALSVVRIQVSGSARTSASVPVTADTVLRDGSGAGSTSGGTARTLDVRADGTVDGRRVVLLRFPVSAATAAADQVLLTLRAANTSRSGTIQAHVYGVDAGAWSEGSASWSGLGSILASGVPAGSRIENGIVRGQGVRAWILGQLVTTSTSLGWKQIDVTEHVRTRAVDGWVSFLIVQDHRWDLAIPARTVGDTQADGIRIASRESGSSVAPRLITFSSGTLSAAARLPVRVVAEASRDRVRWEAPVRVAVSVVSRRAIPAGRVVLRTGGPDAGVVGGCRLDRFGQCRIRLDALAVAPYRIVAAFRPARGFRVAQARFPLVVLRPAGMEPTRLALGPATTGEDGLPIVPIRVEGPDACLAGRTIAPGLDLDGDGRPETTLGSLVTDPLGLAQIPWPVPGEPALAEGTIVATLAPAGPCEGAVTSGPASPPPPTAP